RQVTRTRTAPHWQPPVWASFRAMHYRLHVVSIRVDDESTIVMLVIVGPRSRATIVASTIGHSGRIESVHVSVARCDEGIVTTRARVLGLGQPKIRLVLAVAADFDAASIFDGHFGQQRKAQ